MPTTVTRPVTGVRPSTRYLRREHVVTGTAVELSNIVRAHRAAGTFVGMSEPHAVTGGRFQVRMALLERAPARPVPRVRRRSRCAWCIAGGASAAVLVLAGVGYLLGRLVLVVVANLPLILGGLAVLLMLAVALGRAGVCAGVHCGGCKSH